MAQQLTKVFTIQEREIRLFARRFLGARLNRSARTLRRWIKRKVVPTQVFKNHDKSFWLCADELKIFEKAFAQDDVKTGINSQGSLFSMVVTAEISQLKENIRKDGVRDLDAALDIDDLVDELNLIRNMSNWKRR